MNAQDYTSLSDQVARQTPELVAYDADIAERQPVVDSLQAAVTAAQADVDAFTEQRTEAAAMEDGLEKAEALAAIDAALAPAQDALKAAQEAQAGPATELANVTARADAIRTAIAQCQTAMHESGLALDSDAMQSQRMAEARAAMWLRIKAHRERLSDSGGYTTAGKWFHSDPKSKAQQLGLVIAGAGVPPIPWKTMDGSFITMSQSLAGAIFQAAMQQEAAIFARAEEHRVAMEAAADPASYDFSGGWPATFGS